MEREKSRTVLVGLLVEVIDTRVKSRRACVSVGSAAAYTGLHAYVVRIWELPVQLCAVYGI